MPISMHRRDRRKGMKKILSILLCFCAFLSSGCAKYKLTRSEINEAHAFAEKFCYTLQNDDIEKAKEYLCSDYSAPPKEDFEKYLAKLESYNNIDFSEEIIIHDRSYNGCSAVNAAHELIFEMLIGGKEISLFFLVLKVEDGYELFSFGINPSR